MPNRPAPAPSASPMPCPEAERQVPLELVAESPWFDGQWYTQRYPDVALSGLPAVSHYLQVGEPLGRQAGPHFDAGYYRERYPDVAASGQSALLHFIQNGEREGRVSYRSAARQLEEALWQRDAIDASLAALHRLLQGSDEWEASYAGWALACWYAWQGQWPSCLSAIQVCTAHAALPPSTPATRLLHVEALTRCGQLAQAYRLGQALREEHPTYLDAHLALANVLSAQGHALAEPQARQLQDHLRLERINALYRQAGIAPLVWHRPMQPLSLESLVPEQITPHPGGESPQVSVIMPVYNAADFLATALHSLLAQTFEALEVLVVDDASTDASLSVAEAFAQQDKRVRVLRQPINQGAYAARNRGLKEARGALITVHDSDDWSHPEKIARQAAAMEANPGWVVCSSDMVRCTTQLTFGRWCIAEVGGWTYRNTSSLMMRRQVVHTLGYWDRVRCTADTEYLHRIWAAFGQQAFGEVLPGVPLALCRDEPTSLSQAGPTHLVTQFKGVRYDYMAAAHAWHARADRPEDLYLPDDPSERPFLAPALNLPR